MKPSNDPEFNYFYERHCKHLELKGPQPKTIDAYTPRHSTHRRVFQL